MKAVSFFDKATGLLNGTHFLASDDRAVALNTPPGHEAIDGHHDSVTLQVNLTTKKVIARAVPPAASAADPARAATAELMRLEASLPRALLDHALSKPGALERLQGIAAAIAKLAPR